MAFAEVIRSEVVLNNLGLVLLSVSFSVQTEYRKSQEEYDSAGD